MQAFLSILVLRDASRVSGVDWKEEASSSSPEQIMHSTNALEPTLIFLKCMLNEHVFMNLVKILALTYFGIW